MSDQSYPHGRDPFDRRPYGGSGQYGDDPFGRPPADPRPADAPPPAYGAPGQGPGPAGAYPGAPLPQEGIGGPYAGAEPPPGGEAASPDGGPVPPDYSEAPPPRRGRRGLGWGGCADGCGSAVDLGDCACCLLDIFTSLVILVRILPAALGTPRHRHPHADHAPRGRLAARLHRAVRSYQREISPKRPPCCRYTPTCSAYAAEALTRHGALRGTWLTVRRLCRCRPGAPRGNDPVPA